MRAAPLRPSRSGAMALRSTLLLQQQLHVRSQGLRTGAVAGVKAASGPGCRTRSWRRMVHGVAGGRLALHLLVVDLEFLGEACDLLGLPRSGQETRVENWSYRPQDLRRVALGVQGWTKQSLDLVARSGPISFLGLGQFTIVVGAHVGTLGVAEDSTTTLPRKSSGCVAVRCDPPAGKSRRIRRRSVDRLELGLLSPAAGQMLALAATRVQIERVWRAARLCMMVRKVVVDSSAANSHAQVISEKRKVLRASASE